MVFWKSLHLEVASGSFCFLINAHYLLIFALIIVLFIFTGFNIYCWAGIYFSWSYSLILFHLNFGLIYSFHIWSRDLLREFTKKYEILLMVLFLLFGGFLVSEALLFVSFFWASFHLLSSPTLGMWVWEGFYLEDPCELTFANTLLLSNAAVSLGGAFISLEISSGYIIFFALWSFFLSSLFISLQIKEFRVLALSINDSLYSSLFFFLTGLHFFHLSVGLILLICFWSGRKKKKNRNCVDNRILEVHLFYNCGLFYWHLIEILWLFIFLVFYYYLLSFGWGFGDYFLIFIIFFYFSIFKNPIHFTLLKIIIFLFVSLGFLSRFLRFLSMLFAPYGLSPTALMSDR